MDVGRVDAAGGQDVDPDVFELQRSVAEIEGKLLGEGFHVLVERFDQILEDRKAVGQVGQRGITGVAGITVLLAPVLAGLVIFRDGPAGGFEFGRIDGGLLLGKRGAVEAGNEEGIYSAHDPVLAEQVAGGEGVMRRVRKGPVGLGSR